MKLLNLYGAFWHFAPDLLGAQPYFLWLLLLKEMKHFASYHDISNHAHG